MLDRNVVAESNNNMMGAAGAAQQENVDDGENSESESIESSIIGEGGIESEYDEEA